MRQRGREREKQTDRKATDEEREVELIAQRVGEVLRKPDFDYEGGGSRKRGHYEKKSFW